MNWEGRGAGSLAELGIGLAEEAEGGEADVMPIGMVGELDMIVK